MSFTDTTFIPREYCEEEVCRQRDWKTARHIDRRPIGDLLTHGLIRLCLSIDCLPYSVRVAARNGNAERDETTEHRDPCFEPGSLM